MAEVLNKVLTACFWGPKEPSEAQKQVRSKLSSPLWHLALSVPASLFA